MSEADGYVIIGTKVDNSGFEKDIGDLEKAEDGVKDLEVTPDVKGGGKMLAIIGAIAVVAIGVVKAFKMIKEENGETWAKLQQIGGALKNLGNVLLTAFGNLFVPILEKIVNFLYTIVSYVNYLAKAWFNVDLFAKSSVNDFKKANKAAKEMKKTTLGFDTANILGSSGTAGQKLDLGVESLPKLEDVPIPSWLEWIKDHGKETAITIGLIAGAILLLKYNTEIFFGLGIGMAITGIALAIKGVIDFIKDPSWKNFITILKGLALAVAGVTIAMLAFNAANPLTWIALAIAAIVLLGIAIYENWEKIKGWFSRVGEWFDKSIIQPIKDGWNNLSDFTKKIIKGIANIVIDALNVLINGLNFFLSPFRAGIAGLGKIFGKNWNLGNVKIPKIPRLAVGGVINMPGRGINYGGANIAERGAEGVIPLTNDQSLQMIADAIAQRMNITLDITNKIDGRVLNKQLEQVKAKNSFARNGV